MNEIINQQTLLFVKSIQIGIMIAVLYDLIRIFRKMIKHPNWMVQVEDVLYWLMCILIGFSSLYMHNYGDIRLFIFIGMILGAIFYFATLSVFFMKIATWIIELAKQVIHYVIHMLSIPIKWLIRLLMIPVRFVERQLHSLCGYGKRKNKDIRRKYYYHHNDFKTSVKVIKQKNVYPKKKVD